MIRASSPAPPTAIPTIAPVLNPLEWWWQIACEPVSGVPHRTGFPANEEALNLVARGLEWTSSHQCTSWGWARSTRLRMNILPARRDFFFHLLSALKFSTSPSYLPPPTYHLPTPPPLTPSPKLQRPQAAVERELELWLWSGSWSCGYGAGAGATGAGAGPAGVGVGPTHPRKGKMLTFFYFLFFLFCLKKAWEVFFFFYSIPPCGWMFCSSFFMWIPCVFSVSILCSLRFSSSTSSICFAELDPTSACLSLICLSTVA